jgi:hypothetical protein
MNRRNLFKSIAAALAATPVLSALAPAMARVAGHEQPVQGLDSIVWTKPQGGTMMRIEVWGGGGSGGIGSGGGGDGLTGNYHAESRDIV